MTMPRILAIMALNSVATMAAIEASGYRRDPRSGLLYDEDGFTSEADREATLFMQGHNVTLSPAARTIVEERMRRDPVKFVETMTDFTVQPYQRDALRALAPKPRRKFKHNRRG